MRMEDALVRADLPRSEAEVLLSALLGCDRSWFLAHPEAEVPPEKLDRWHDWVTRRRRGEPAAYITGWREFCGRRFRTDPRALIPRPATERLVELALGFMDQPQDKDVELDTRIVGITRVLRGGVPTTIVDLGTGSGCIALTLALAQPDLRVIATDVSPDAVALAAENATSLGLRSRIDLRSGTDLDPVAELVEPFLLISNPPYIPAGTALEHTVEQYEPATALFAGPDGTDVLERIAQQARAHPACAGLVVECRAEQAAVIDRVLHRGRSV